jgi:thiosulfate/3-mercaptopyruvate sulfurtransferase
LKPLVSPDYLESARNSANLRIVDCRFDLMDPSAGEAQYLNAHIPGAVYADLDRHLAAPVSERSGRHPLPSVGNIAATFAEFGISNDSAVVVYDSGSGAFAARMWWMLRWLGHDNVSLLDGGFAAWTSLSMPVEQGKQTVSRGTFVATERPELLLPLQELVDNKQSAHGKNLVDARDAARFRGEVEPIDPVAGHIPGALSLPFTDALRDDGGWKSPSELRTLWSGVLGEDPETPSAVMCGSGVTACHLVLSAILAGYREPRVYIGSWSEWIRDTGRPVATGHP